MGATAAAVAIVVAPTAADARDVLVEGPSGILACSPPWWRPVYEPSKRRLTWPSGAIATLYSADEPERLRRVKGAQDRIVDRCLMSFWAERFLYHARVAAFGDAPPPPRPDVAEEDAE